jgi:AraC-like DNA-binding protein
VLYREFLPGSELARFVQCFWILEQAAHEAPRQKVVPDGRMELLVHLGDPVETILEDGSRWPGQTGSLLVGQIRRHITLSPKGRVEILGVRLHPGAAFPLFRVDLDEMVDDAVPLSAFRPALGRELEGCLSETRGWTERVRAVERTLIEGLARKAGRPELPEVVAESIERGGGRQPVSGLARRFGVGVRTLERRFRREVGLSPKRLARIVRLQGTFSLLGRTARPSWAEIAFSCGYSDQPHLVREFRELTGEPPATFLSSGHELSDHLTGLVRSDEGAAP